VLKTANAQPTLWEALVPEACLGLPAELEAVDRLLDDPVFLEPYRAHFYAALGRPSVPVSALSRYRARVGPVPLAASSSNDEASNNWRSGEQAAKDASAASNATSAGPAPVSTASTAPGPRADTVSSTTTSSRSPHSPARRLERHRTRPPPLPRTHHPTTTRVLQDEVTRQGLGDRRIGPVLEVGPGAPEPERPGVQGCFDPGSPAAP
jgi:hypothetical protein